MSAFTSLRTVAGYAIGCLLLVVLLFAAPSASARTPAEPKAGASSGAQLSEPIPGHYIITLKPGVEPGAITAPLGAAPGHVYRAALQGFAAQLSGAQIAQLQHNPLVERIEQDQIVRISATTQTHVNTWGLDRIDQHSLPLNTRYTYNATGSDANAYIIDTGIQTTNADFGGRAAVGFDALGGNGQDCNGHGTHVSGTIGGTTYGVAKQVHLWAVRVLDCSGSGTLSGVIDGVDWVATHHAGKAVANMSLGGGFSASLNTAVTNMSNSGVFVAVAAGNGNADACNVSPASANGTYTVAASDRTDTRASFSNFGACVDGYAPGVAITSDWLNDGTNTISGTSMATPHVTGAGALYKNEFGDAAASTITTWINDHATTGVIKNNRRNTPSRLLFMGGLL